MRIWMVTLLSAALLMIGAGHVSAAEQHPLIPVVNKLYGVPYKTAGMTPKGFDCSGFTLYVFNQLGVHLPHSSAAQYRLGTAVPRNQLQPGDLVFFNTNGRGVSHVGIYIGNQTFVHSASGKGVVNTRLDDPYYWSKRYVGAKRIAIPTGKQANP